MKRITTLLVLLSSLFLSLDSCDQYRFSERKYRPGIFHDRITQNYSGSEKNISAETENNISDEQTIDTIKKNDDAKSFSKTDKTVLPTRQISRSPQNIGSNSIAPPHQIQSTPIPFSSHEIKEKNETKGSDDGYDGDDTNEDAALASAIFAVVLAFAMWLVLIYALPACADLIWVILLLGICAFGLAAVSIDETKRKIVQAIDVMVILATCVFVILAIAAVIGGNSKSCSSHSSSHTDWNFHSHSYSHYNSGNTYQDSLKNNNRKMPEQRKY